MLIEEDSKTVRFVNQIFMDAVRTGVSDIHIEPYEQECRIRYRQDGILRTVTNVPLAQSVRIVARIKILAQLDIAERRIPQDGRIKLKLSTQDVIDLRVNTCPTLFGEKVALRILDAEQLVTDFQSLGYSPVQAAYFLKAIQQPQGLILVTGPTGSGKTVSLYTAIRLLNTVERNILTVEDPIEIYLPGVNQVHVNLKTGLTFSTALRAFLRQDPDIIMVGEIRDKETAAIAVHAAQTGHLVLSTLHTNSAPETLARLLQMGVEPFDLASSISLIIAQRLARRLCSLCKRPITQVVYQAVGCCQCHQGYHGRTGIFQVLPIGDALRNLIMNRGNAIEITEFAKKEGMLDLQQSGLEKVKTGITSLEEIRRIISDS